MDEKKTIQQINAERKAEEAAKVPAYIKAACREILSKVRFEHAGLNLPGHDLGKSDEDTAAIREACRLYMDSWVIPLVEAIRDGDKRFLKDMMRYYH